MPVPQANPLSLPPPKPKQTSYVVLKDFQAGIQGLVDKTAIPLNATPMCRNVVFRSEGGFMIRPSIRPLGRGQSGQPVAALSTAAVWYGDYWRGSPGTGYSSWHMVVTDDNHFLAAKDIQANTVGDGVWVDLGFTRIGRVTTEVFNSDLYVSLGHQESNSSSQRMVRWNGTTVSPLGTAWSEDIEAPTTGNMPPARYLAWMNERMWVANLATADGLGMRNRIHFSHLGQAQAWRSEDWMDIGGPDEITGIMAMRDMLVVFKRDSTWAIQGYGEESFRVIQISAKIGSQGFQARNADYGVVFWDRRLGVCQFNGRGIENLFGPLLPFMSIDMAITDCFGLESANGDMYALTDYSGYGASTETEHPQTWAEVVATPLTWNQMFQNQWRWFDLVVFFGAVVWQLQTSAGAGWTAHSAAPGDTVPVSCLGVNRASSHGRTTLVIGYQPPGETASTFLTWIVGGQSNGLDRFNPEWWDFKQAGSSFNYATTRWTGALLWNTDNGDVQQWYAELPAELGLGKTPGWRSLGNVSDQALIGQLNQRRLFPIDAWYLTPWMHAGLPGQIKRFRAPRVVQEGDQVGDLLIDVFYDYGEANLRRQLVVPVATAPGRWSYSVNKPGTVGRARSIQFRIHNDNTHPRHWGVSQIALPYHPKRMR